MNAFEYSAAEILKTFNFVEAGYSEMHYPGYRLLITIFNNIVSFEWPWNSLIHLNWSKFAFEKK